MASKKRGTPRRTQRKKAAPKGRDNSPWTGAELLRSIPKRPDRVATPKVGKSPDPPPDIAPVVRVAPAAGSPDSDSTDRSDHHKLALDALPDEPE